MSRAVARNSANAAAGSWWRAGPAQGRFAGLESVVIPEGYRDLFEAVAEEEFRADVSSTSLRGA